MSKPKKHHHRYNRCISPFCHKLTSPCNLKLCGVTYNLYCKCGAKRPEENRTK